MVRWDLVFILVAWILFIFSHFCTCFFLNTFCNNYHFLFLYVFCLCCYFAFFNAKGGELCIMLCICISCCISYCDMCISCCDMLYAGGEQLDIHTGYMCSLLGESITNIYPCSPCVIYILTHECILGCHHQKEREC